MNKYSNIFNQILQLLPRYEFERLVKERAVEKHAKGFYCWDQLVSMIFLQLSKSCSLTEICQGVSNVRWQAGTSWFKQGSRQINSGICKSA